MSTPLDLSPFPHPAVLWLPLSEGKHLCGPCWPAQSRPRTGWIQFSDGSLLSVCNECRIGWFSMVPGPPGTGHVLFNKGENMPTLITDWRMPEKPTPEAVAVAHDTGDGWDLSWDNDGDRLGDIPWPYDHDFAKQSDLEALGFDIV